MTFGRPCMIPESYVKLGMPVKDMQMLGPTLQIEPGPQRDAYFFTAAMYAPDEIQYTQDQSAE